MATVAVVGPSSAGGGRVCVAGEAGASRAAEGVEAARPKGTRGRGESLGTATGSRNDDASSVEIITVLRR